MFVRFPRSLVVVISLLVVLILLLPAGSLSSTAITAQPATGKVLRTSPVMFIENVGQFAEGARFQVHGGNYTLWLAEDALWITVVEPERGATEGQSNPAGLDSPLRTDPAVLQPVNGVNIRLSFIGANPHPRLEPFDRLDTHVSYFRGNDPAQWHADVPVWGSARYVDLYSGVDLELTSEGGQMVQRLTVHPGADLSLVRLRVEGADAVAVDQNVVRLSAVAGEVAVPLLLTAGASGEAIVQPQGAQAFEVIAPFTQLPSKRPSTSENQLSPADHPEDLLYGTFLGGSDEDGGNAIAADGTGSVYVTGSTWSSDFPTTPGAFDTNLNGDTDAFVVKLNSAGSGLAYATFLGGNDRDYGNAITVDGAGNAYVTGDTCSSDFPVTLGAFDTSFNNDSGVSDAFVIKLNPAGSGLAYGTFLGSTSTDWAYAITVDGASNAYVTGETHYRDFPTTPGAFDTSFNSTYMPEAFVVKMNSAGSGLIYATFLGGSGEDGGHAIAVDGAGNAYVAGFTTYGYPPFPTTPGAFDTSFNGSYDSDAFVVKLNPGGSGLAYGTFLGGSGNERIIAIAIDDAGNVYVTGKTASSNFPTTLGAFDTSFNGGNTDAFVVKLNSAGSGLAYATFLGGNNLDDGNAIAVDWAGNAYVAGTTGSSANFPLTVGALATVFGGATTDAFVARLDATGSQLTYSTFLGGIGLDDARDIALDPEGDVVHVTGQTFSSNFPLTANAFDSTLNYGDAFIVKLRLRGGPLIPTPTPTITPTPTSTPTSTSTPTNTPTATPGPSPTPTPTPPPPIVLYPHTDGWLRGYPASQVGSASVSSSQRSADWYYALSGPMSGNTYKLLELSLNPLSSACWACLDFKFISQTSVGGSERVLASTNRCVDGIGDLFSQTLNGESANGALLVFRMTWTSGTCAGTLTFGSPTFSRIEIPGVLPSTSTPTATPTATPSPTPTRTSTPTVTPTRTQTATPRAKVYLPLLLRNQ